MSSASRPPTAALSCTCLSFAQVRTYHEFIFSCIPERISCCFRNQNSHFVLSLRSTRVSFRGFLEQHHLSTKLAAHLELGAQHRGLAPSWYRHDAADRVAKAASDGFALVQTGELRNSLRQLSVARDNNPTSGSDARGKPVHVTPAVKYVSQVASMRVSSGMQLECTTQELTGHARSTFAGHQISARKGCN